MIGARRGPVKEYECASGALLRPDYLFDTENHFEVLSEKCLIERPNSCVDSWLLGKMIPLTYWARASDD